MDRIEHNITIKGLAVSTAMAGALLSGCTTTQAPSADLAAANAQEAMSEGRHDRAVRHAEDAVRADPHNATYRAMLGKAYLDAGRFASAQASFDDAMQLGDTSPRTALSLALSLTAQAKYTEAAALLNDWDGKIAVADLGLALALAGQPERGIHQMTNAIRAGENTVKMRQNLAFAYAVAGRWREARLMASQDVPADQVSSRIEQWAAMASPLAYQQRVAGLLGVPSGVADHGQPVELALANNPSIDQLAAEATDTTAFAAFDGNGELPAVSEPAPPVSVAPDGRMSISASAAELPSVGRPAMPVGRYAPPSTQSSDDFAQAFAPEAAASSAMVAPAPMPQLERDNQIVFISNPVIQQIPGVEHAEDKVPSTLAQADTSPRISGRPIASRSIPAAGTPVSPAAPIASLANGADEGHLVQLGSFSSQENAERAWEIYVSRYPELANHDRVITEAVLNGKRYFRVSASGFGQTDSNSMCERVDNSNGDGCISWAAANPLPGAVSTGIQFASR